MSRVVLFDAPGPPGPAGKQGVPGTMGARGKDRPGFYIADFGAKGDGSDDSAALLAAIAAVQAAQGELFLEGKTYGTSVELKLDGSGFGLTGTNGDISSGGTIIKALSSARSVVTIEASNNPHIHGVVLDGNGLASYGAYLQGSAFGTFEKCTFKNALVDGIYLAHVNDSGTATVNDTNSFKDCSLLTNGTLYVSSGMAATFGSAYGNKQVNLGGALASCTSGTTTVTVSGVDLTALGIRAGDWVRLDVSSPQYLQVVSLSGTSTIVAASGKLPTVTKTNVAFAIGVGDGYHEYSHADNNLTQWSGGLIRSNAGSGMIFCGLYGPQVNLPQLDTAAFFGIVLSNFYGGTLYASIVNAYFEGCLAASLALGSAQGLALSGIGSDNYIVGSSGANWGVLQAGQAGLDIQPVGGVRMNIPVRQGYAGGFTHVGPVLDTQQNGTLTSTTATLSPATSYVMLHAASDLVMASTPTITAGTDGQRLTLVMGDAHTITLQDRGTLPSSGLFLSASTVALSQYDNINLLYVAGVGWVQTSLVNVL